MPGEQEICVTNVFGERALKKKVLDVDFKVETEETEDLLNLLSLEEKNLIDRNFKKDSSMGEYPAANGSLEDNLLLEGKLKKGRLLDGKGKKKELRTDKDPENKLPGGQKSIYCGKENTIPAQRTPTSVSSRNRNKQTLGLSPMRLEKLEN